MANPKKYPPEPEQPLIAHLVELRNRLLRIIGVVLAAFLALVPFANQLYSLLALPLIERLPQGTTMIATEVASPLLVPIKFALVVACFIVVPFILHQLWRFIAPGLYKSERRLALPLLVSSTLLFYSGVVFAYLLVLPLVFAFLVTTAPPGVAVMTDIGQYLGFVLKLFFAFGVAFEVPVATVLMVWAGITTRQSLAAKRPYIIVGAFVIGMLLTPPDMLSQTLLAIPMWLLFEAGLFISRYYEQPPRVAAARGAGRTAESGED